MIFPSSSSITLHRIFERFDASFPSVIENRSFLEVLCQALENISLENSNRAIGWRPESREIPTHSTFPVKTFVAKVSV